MSKEYPSAVFTQEQYEALMKKQQQEKNNRQTVEKNDATTYNPTNLQFAKTSGAIAGMQLEQDIEYGEQLKKQILNEIALGNRSNTFTEWGKLALDPNTSPEKVAQAKKQYDAMQAKQPSYNKDTRTNREKAQAQKRFNDMEKLQKEMEIKAIAVTGNTNQARSLASNPNNWTYINTAYNNTAPIKVALGSTLINPAFSVPYTLARATDFYTLANDGYESFGHMVADKTGLPVWLGEVLNPGYYYVAANQLGNHAARKFEEKLIQQAQKQFMSKFGGATMKRPTGGFPSGTVPVKAQLPAAKISLHLEGSPQTILLPKVSTVTAENVVKAGKAVNAAAKKESWVPKHFPGYQLKILMEGSPLEKSINKNGLINVNVLRSQLNSTSKVNKEIIENVLNTKFAGQKNIDYNDLRKAVQEELVTFDTNEVIKFRGYGIDQLGYQMSGSKFSGGSPDVDLYSVVFSSEKIPNGNATHYSPNTLAHSRTFTDPNEPDVLYVMESQSDWAQQFGSGKTKARKAKYKADLVKHIQDNIKNYPEQFVKSSDVYIELADAQRFLEDKIGDVIVPTAHEKYLIDNYVRRLVQENMRLAATKGQTKMRYPTPETAAKIQYYPKEHTVTTYPIADGKMQNDVVNLLENMSLRNKPKKTIFNQKYYSLGAFGRSDLHLVNGQLVRKEGELGMPVYQLMDPEYTEMIQKLPDLQFDPNYSLYPNYSKLKQKWDVWENWLRSQKVKATTETVQDYSPEHQTILKKYTEFPDIYRSIIKDGDVKTVTDAKGNTWYEVDVPENFLDMELLYKKGGALKQRFE